MSSIPNILIVDDNFNNLLYLEVLLRKLPARLIQASSGMEALETTKDMDLSLAILDVQMPIMNGFELAVRLNEDRAGQKIPIIFLTAAFPTSSKIEEGYGAGAVDYIIKPLNKSILISKINVFLELYWQKVRLIENAEKLRISESNLLEAKQQLEQLNQHLVRVIEEERTAISFQVHDELGQAMTALKMDMSWIRQNMEKKDQVEQKLGKMLGMTDDVIRKVQRISSELHPGMLEDLGLVSAIEWYCGEFEERTGIPCKLSLDEMDDEVSTVNLTLFRIIQEALTNMIRHSKATASEIQLLNQSEEIILHISDNGVGSSQEKLTSGKSFGIIAMQQRVQQCGGSIEFLSKPGKGISIEVRIPKKSIS
ncbi:MAG: response regulator [Bacteroidales bacterium]|nr:response regulator [Bacteroidales bacterium]